MDDENQTGQGSKDESRPVLPMETTGKYWAKVRMEPRSYGLTAEQAEKFEAFFGHEGLTPVEDPEGLVAWFDSTLDADHWFSMADIGSDHAAKLLCQFNPNSDGADAAEAVTTDETTPQDFVKLRQRFDDLARQNPRSRSLRDWLHAAKELCLRHHSWIDKYLAAKAIIGDDRPGQLEDDEATAPIDARLPTRRTWRVVAKPYMVERLQAERFATAVELNHALHDEAGSPESPFDKGKGMHRGKLVVREIGQPLALKTIQNAWQELRRAAARS